MRYPLRCFVSNDRLTRVLLRMWVFLWFVCVAYADTSLTDFATGASGWKSRTWAQGKPQLGDLSVSKAETGRAAALLVPIDFKSTTREVVGEDGKRETRTTPVPSRTEVVCPIANPSAWAEAQWLSLKLQAPANLPDGTMLTIFTKDGDDLWRQVRRPLKGGLAPQEFRVPLRGLAAVRAWTCEGHRRPWSPTTARFLQEYGLIL